MQFWQYAIVLLLVLASLVIADKAFAVNEHSGAKVTAMVCKGLADGELQVLDLSHDVNSKTPSYDGKSDEYSYKQHSSVEKDGYMSGEFCIPEHFGTHVDAPAHFIAGAATIDKIEPANLVMPAVVIDVREKASSDPDYAVSIDEIRNWEKSKSIDPGCAVLLLTGWGERYKDQQKYRNPDEHGVMHFPGYSEQATKYLVNDRKVKILGIDTLSIDIGKSEEFPAHKAALSHNVVLVENLDNLQKLPSRGSLVIIAPLKLTGGSGSPARVMALIPSK